MQPLIIESTFQGELRKRILMDSDMIVRKGNTIRDTRWGRDTSNSGRLYCYSEHLLPLVRETFEDNTILPSYNCWARYAGSAAKLERHKDRNACTFTVDYCVRQGEPWPLYVNDQEYVLEENQSLMFMGEDQEHWRPAFSPGNFVEMIFFHFVRPDHWYFN